MRLLLVRLKFCCPEPKELSHLVDKRRPSGKSVGHGKSSTPCLCDLQRRLSTALIPLSRITRSPLSKMVASRFVSVMPWSAVDQAKQSSCLRMVEWYQQTHSITGVAVLHLMWLSSNSLAWAEPWHMYMTHATGKSSFDIHDSFKVSKSRRYNPILATRQCNRSKGCTLILQRYSGPTSASHSPM